MGVLRILPQGADRPRTVVDMNPQIKTWELGEQAAVRWTNGRGDTLEGILIKPVHYEEGKR